MAKQHIDSSKLTQIQSAIFQSSLNRPPTRHRFRHCNSAILPQSSLENVESSSMNDCLDVLEISDISSVTDLLQSDITVDQLIDIVPRLQTSLWDKVSFN